MSKGGEGSKYREANDLEIWAEQVSGVPQSLDLGQLGHQRN
jgi:hypothetical protein